MRLDRALTLGMVHPLSRVLNGYRASRIPILMYHGIRPGLRQGHPYFETSTSPEFFALQMKLLRETGYSTVTLEEVLQLILTGDDCAKRVAITFDDGYQDFYTRAYPVLSYHGFTATVFVVTSLVGGAKRRANGESYMTWNELREVCKGGMQVGSHTVSHPDLRALDPDRIDFELTWSRIVIEENLGRPVRSFAYPFAFPEEDGDFTNLIRDLLQAAGYENGVTTIIGTAGKKHDWFFLPRLPVNSFDDLSLFRAKLEGGYDWLHYPQFLRKWMKQAERHKAAGERVSAGA